jgi:hypothetical protein
MVYDLSRMVDAEGELPNVPDDADSRVVLRYLRMCAAAWEPGVRLLGNLRACDIVRAVDEILGATRPTGAQDHE